MTNLRNLKQELKASSKQNMCNLEDKVAEARYNLEVVWDLLERNPSSISLVEQEEECKKRLVLELEREECYWKQRSRVNWLKLGGQKHLLLLQDYSNEEV